MSRFLLLCVLSAFIFAQCEDNKKPPQEKTATEANTQKKDTVVYDKEANTTPVALEKITQKNVVSFLSEYGKNNPETKVKISTRLGDIVIQLNTDTPLHRANFVYLIKEGYFNDTFFHRVVPKFIIQGGNSDNYSTNKKRFALGNNYLVPAEIKHKFVYGSLSGAKEYRENPSKMSEPFEFFIFLGQPVAKRHLDGNYTVFGNVINGMDVVEKIANTPAAEDEWPRQNVVITATVLK